MNSLSSRTGRWAVKLSIRSLAVLLAGVGTFSSALAQTFTWTGHTNNTWGAGSNWTSGSGTAPNSATANVFFGAATNHLPNFNANATFLSITYNADAVAYTISRSGGTVTLADEGSITNNSSNLQTISAPITLAGSSTWDTETDDVTVSGVLSGSSGSLTKYGNSVLTLLGTNTYRGITTITEGTLQIGNGGTSGTLGTGGVQDDNILIFDRSDSITVGNLISGEGGITQAGNGTLTLNSTNTYTGGTTVQSGTLQITNASALGSADGHTTVANGATLTVSNIAVNSEGYDLTGTGVNGNGALVSTGTSSLAGAVNLDNDTTISVTGSLNIGAYISTSDPADVLTKIGTGTLTLSGSDDNTSLIVVVSAGILVLAKDSSGGVHALEGGLTVDSGATAQLAGAGDDQISTDTNVQIDGTLDFNGRDEGFQNLSGSGVLTNTASGTTSTFTLGENDADSTFSGTLKDGAGILAFNKVGGGTVTLSGANTYSGGTTVQGGILEITNASALGSTSGTTTVEDGATLLVTNTAVNAQNYDFTGSGTDGSGALLSTGTSSLAGTINLDGDTAIGVTDSLTITANISGDHTLTKLGSGTLTLSGSNSQLENDVNEGTLEVTNSGALGSTSGNTFVSDGATLLITNTTVNAQIYDISGTGTDGNGALVSTGTSSITGTFNVDDDTTVNVTGSLNIDAGISTGSVLTKIGTGTLTLSGIDDNSDLTVVVSTGTLVLSKDSSENVHAIGSGLTVDNGATAQLAGTGGDQIRTDATVEIDGTLDFNGQDEGLQSLSGSGVLTNTAAGTTSTFTLGENDTDSTFSGTMQDGAGLLALNKVGAGTLTLTGNNTYTGGTTLSGGIVNLGSTGAIGTSGTITFDGGGLQFTDANTIDYSTRFSTADNQQFLIDTNGQDVTFTQALTSSGGSLQKLGDGKLTLSGANAFDGVTTIQQGTLAFSDDTAPGSTLGEIDLSDGATLELDDAKVSSSSTIHLTGSGVNGVGALVGTGTSSLAGTVNFDNDTTIGVTGSLTITGDLTGGDTLSKIGTGTLTLSGSNSQSTNDVDEGTLEVASADALGETDGSTTVDDGATLLVTNTALNSENYNINGTLASTGTSSIAGNITSDTGATVNVTGSLDISAGITTGNTLTKTGTGTLTLSGTDDNSGLSIVVSTGTLVLAKDSSDGVHAIGASLTVDSGATAQLSGTGGDQINGGANVQIDGTLDFNGRNEGFQNLSGSGVLTNTATGTTSTFALGENDTDSTFAGTMQDGAGVLAFDKVGGGTVELDGANSYSGGTTIEEGTLQVGGGGTSGNLGSGGITNDGELVYNRSGTLTENNVISGEGNLTQAGAGKLILTGTNTYTGTTTVNSGILQVDGSIASSTTTVNGGTLQGSGILGDVTMNAGTTLMAGNSTTLGHLTLGALTFNENATLQFKLDSSIVQSDSFTLTGQLTLNNTQLVLNDLSTIPFVIPDGATFTLISYSDGMGDGLGSGTDIFTFDGQVLSEGSTFTADGHTFQINYATGDPAITLTSLSTTPEPGTWLLLASGLGTLALIQHRKRSVLTSL